MSHALLGQSVKVLEPKLDDLWSHEFIGTIVAVKNGFVSVQDQAGDVFDVEESQYEKILSS